MSEYNVHSKYNGLNPPLTNLHLEDRIACVEILLRTIIDSLDPELNKNIIKNLDATYEMIDTYARKNDDNPDRFDFLQDVYNSYLTKILPDKNPGYED